MIVQKLNGLWNIKGGNYNADGNIPGSVYSVLLENNLISDPFYRDNEEKALALMDNEFVFTKKFYFDKKGGEFSLVCEGIDTLSNIYLNDIFVGHSENMHIVYRFNITNALKKGENILKIFFPPIDAYIKQKDKEKTLWGADQSLKGYTHIRKAHYMFGWDWGPKLPDAGIWRSIYIEDDSARIDDFRILQRHENGRVFLTVNVTTTKDSDVSLMIINPQGEQVRLKNFKEIEIQNPELWYPNGLGKQPLYTVSATVMQNGKTVDEKKKKIGLRTLILHRDIDEYGLSFYHEINGVKFFACGANYIPEDNIISRVTPERTEKLIQDCIFANYNAIRVWGGGYYPDDWFFDLCDKYGLVVFFDLMFACSNFDYCEEFTAQIKEEVGCNIKRIRHHACLAVISGNNEIEESWTYKTGDMGGYINLFEKEIPEFLDEICPEIPYVSSSPSGFGSLDRVSDENYGDTHYWDVWHHDLPFSAYRKHYFRYLSEFGFQSFPNFKTVEEFTEPKDRNVFSRVMELHQKNPSANGKILNYLAQTFLYPTRFDILIYASQLLQAEAMKYAVEHLRRNRGRCMGALYWQLNDVWPVASWSSIDSRGRYKALHYVARRFYESIHISCLETGEFSTRKDVNDERIIPYDTKAQLFVNNETLQAVSGVVKWKLCNSLSETIRSGEISLTVPALSVVSTEEMDFHKTDVNNNYIYYEFVVDNQVVSSGTSIFTKPKYFQYKNPELKSKREGNKITVSSRTFAQYVKIDSPDTELVLSDNYFDMNKGEKTVEIISGDPKILVLTSVYDIK